MLGEITEIDMDSSGIGHSISVMKGGAGSGTTALRRESINKNNN